MIPIKYLANMGEHSIKVEGIPVKVNVVDDPDLITSHIKKFEEIVLASDIQVVGLDVKKTTTDLESEKLVLYTAAGSRENINHTCLIIHFCGRDSLNKSNVVKNDLPQSVHQLLLNKGICFVKPSHYYVTTNGVKVGDLAARVLKKPSVGRLSLGEIARQVGVPYAGPPTGVGVTIKLDESNNLVMSEEQVEVAISDAVAYYRIGFQLLSSVMTQPDSASRLKKGLTKYWFPRCFLA